MTAPHVGRRRLAVGLVTAVLFAALSATAPAGVFATGARTPWIVELRPDASLDAVLRTADRYGVKADARFNNLLNGFSAKLTERQRRALDADPRVASIVRDGMVHATGDPPGEVPPGVKRVGSLQNNQRTGGNLNVDIAIVDTGIQPNHPDLNVVGGYNCTGGGTGNWADGTSFGHGTHVAGIAAARRTTAAASRAWPRVRACGPSRF